MINYIGQLRIYSLIDLIILLAATKATSFEFIGVLFLHIGFLAYLEAQHKHSYRKQIPKPIWIIFTLAGLICYSKIEGILFILCSYTYALKDKKLYGIASPIMRGLQYFFLVAGIVGYSSKLTWLAFVLIAVRNFCGDLRDIVKDKNAHMNTMPVVLGLKKNYNHIHLISTLATTFIWFQFTNLSLLFLIPIIFLQVITYRLTPR